MCGCSECSQQPSKRAQSQPERLPLVIWRIANMMLPATHTPASPEAFIDYYFLIMRSAILPASFLSFYQYIPDCVSRQDARTLNRFGNIVMSASFHYYSPLYFTTKILPLAALSNLSRWMNKYPASYGEQGYTRPDGSQLMTGHHRMRTRALFRHV